MADYTAQIQGIYLAYYGRPADVSGLTFWRGKLAASNGNLDEIIEAFGASDEATALYSASSNIDKITAIYLALFDRTPDSDGLSFYVGLLAAGTKSQASIALDILLGAKGDDLDLVEKKLEISADFTAQMEGDSTLTIAYQGDFAASTAREMLYEVTLDSDDTELVNNTFEKIIAGPVEAVETYSLTTALTLAGVDLLPEKYSLTDGETDLGELSVAEAVADLAAAEAIIAGATNADEHELDASYTLTDTVENLAAADADVLDGATSYALSTTAFTADAITTTVADLSDDLASAEDDFFSTEESAIVDGASNASDVEISVAYSLADTLANLADADAADLAAATSYTVSNAAGDLGDITQAEIDIIEAASNAASYTYDLAGDEFTLTTDDDTFTGTAGNDTFTATTSTLSVDDKIVDSSTTDSDVMNITATADPAVMDVSNVENINIIWNSFSTADIDLSDVAGATVTVTSTKSGYLGNVNFTDVGSNNVATGAGITGTLDIEGIEDATVTSTLADEIDIGATTAADGTVTVVAGAATTISIDGGDDVVLTALLADTISLDDGTFDTAALTLGVDADVTVTGATDSVVTIDSDEDITVTIAAASVYEELTVGGTGTVTLVVDAVADLSGLTITNTDGDVELDVALATADFSLVSAENIIFTTEAGAAAVLTIATGQSFVYEDAETGAHTSTFQTTTDDDSTADSVTITLEDEQAAALIFDIASQEVETVNIVIDANADFDDTTDFTIADLQGNSADDTVFVITSSDADIEVLVSAADASEIDASAVEGEFTLTGQTTSEELTISGAVGATTVTFAGTTVDSTYAGQDGDDTVGFITTTGTATAILGDGDNAVNASGILAGTGTLAVTAGSGDNTITVTNATSGSVVAELGAGDNTVTANSLTSGTLSVVTGAGDDVVSATAITSGEVSLSLGAGDNEITLGTALAAAEISITTGAGDDTITMDGDAVDAADISIALGAGTNRLILAADADLTGYTLSLTGLSEIELAAADDDAVIDSELLDGTSIEILSSAAAGTASALLGVELADGTTSFDGSSLTISDSISTAALGLIVTVVTAADDFTIVGSEGADDITVGTGDDTVTGGADADEITLSTGTDVVIFAATTAALMATEVGSTAGTDVDYAIGSIGETITGFTSGTDTLEFDADLVTNVAGTETDTLLEIVAGGTVTSTARFVQITDAAAGDDAEEFGAAVILLNALNTTAVAIGDSFIVAIDNDVDTYLYLVQQVSAANTIAAQDVTLIGVLAGITDVASGDFVSY